MNERDVLLNELAQGLRPMSEGIRWFDGLGQEEQSEVLLFLRHHCRLPHSRPVACSPPPRGGAWAGGGTECPLGAVCQSRL